MRREYGVIPEGFGDMLRLACGYGVDTMHAVRRVGTVLFQLSEDSLWVAGVMHVPKLTVLLSFSALRDEGYELVFQEGTLLI